MINKNEGKKLYAIFKNDIHKGNAYGIDKKDAIISHMKKAQFSISDEIVNEYSAIDAVENIHYSKSEYIKMP